MSEPFCIQRVAVLGAGVMGAQIAAHLANVGVPTVLFEVAGPAEDPRRLARDAVGRLSRQKPPPLVSADVARTITPACYDEDLPLLESCDLVLEAIAERSDLKIALYDRVVPHLAEHAILATNTSGLSLATLAASLPANQRPRFCGVHFFNPPRYMHLVELIPGPDTDGDTLANLETFLTSTLGKGVIRAVDSPNFIANRIGVFSMLVTLHHASRLGLGFDVVDGLTGRAIGRPKSATCRTADVVGLDTLMHVIETSADALPDDPWREVYEVPSWFRTLVDAGDLGQKTGAGIYRKTADGLSVLDPASGARRPCAPGLSEESKDLVAPASWSERLERWRTHESPEGEFLWSIHRDVFHYGATLLASIAPSAREMDLALRWGFGWEQGPFEIWQSAGWGRISAQIAADIAAELAFAKRPLPLWVAEVDAAHTAMGSWDAGRGRLVPRSSLPVYRRQLHPTHVIGEIPSEIGDVVHEDDAVRLVKRDGDMGVLSFKTKMHVVSEAVLDGVQRCIDLAEESLHALVIWHPDAPFSAGADLKQVATLVESGKGLDALIRKFQDTTLRVRGCSVPVVAAARGLVLGGGLELLLHCDRAVVGLETHAGLVEVGVGLLPAGGGLKELASRAASQAADDDPWPFLVRHFETVAEARMSQSAHEARDRDLLRDGDVIVHHEQEILYVALVHAYALAASGYRPPLRRTIRVGGTTAFANLRGRLVNFRAGGFISDHDLLIGTRVAEVLCGGSLHPGTEVPESWFLDREREAFVELASTESTVARIGHMLEKGRPLRN